MLQALSQGYSVSRPQLGEDQPRRVTGIETWELRDTELGDAQGSPRLLTTPRGNALQTKLRQSAGASFLHPACTEGGGVALMALALFTLKAWMRYG